MRRQKAGQENSDLIRKDRQTRFSGKGGTSYGILLQPSHLLSVAVHVLTERLTHINEKNNN